MNFIVLPYSIKSPYSMEYNATLVSNIPNKINQTMKQLNNLQKCIIFLHIHKF